jgi:Na+-transporting methylmalonyl-CoA/oxaloacetate decarboxylase gamma subunit
MDSHLMAQGLEVMLLGLAGVFAVLIIFYAAIRIMLFASRRGKKRAAEENR